MLAFYRDLKGLAPVCERAHFVVRNAPFRVAIKPISHPEMGSFAMQKGQFRKSEAARTLCGQGKTGFSVSIYRVASLQIKKNGMLNQEPGK